MQDLHRLYDDVLVHAESAGLKVFPAAGFDAQPWFLLWDRANDDWRAFIEIGREAGARYLIVAVDRGVDDRAGQIGRMSLAWREGNCLHVYTKQADWWEEETSLEDALRGALSVSTRGYGEGSDEQIRESLKAQPAEQLAHELTELMRQEFPNAEPWGVSSIAGSFWQKKGFVYPYTKDPDIDLKMKKVEALSRQALEEERAARDRDLLPALIDACVEWARDRGLKKVTKSNVDYFLSDKKQSISKGSRDALYNEVNFGLGE